jgi:hypothetical protein
MQAAASQRLAAQALQATQQQHEAYSGQLEQQHAAAVAALEAELLQVKEAAAEQAAALQESLAAAGAVAAKSRKMAHTLQVSLAAYGLRLKLQPFLRLSMSCWWLVGSVH